MTLIDQLRDGGKTGLYIAGQWLAGSGALEVVDPATEEVLAEVADDRPAAWWLGTHRQTLPRNGRRPHRECVARSCDVRSSS